MSTPASPNCKTSSPNDERWMYHVAVLGSYSAKSVLPSPSKSPCSGIAPVTPNGGCANGPAVDWETNHWFVVGR